MPGVRQQAISGIAHVLPFLAYFFFGLSLAGECGRWQNAQSCPDLQEIVVCTKWHGLHSPSPCLLEPTDHSPAFISCCVPFIALPASGTSESAFELAGLWLLSESEWSSKRSVSGLLVSCTDLFPLQWSTPHIICFSPRVKFQALQRTHNVHSAIWDG